MRAEHMQDGVKRIEIDAGERLSVHGYKKGEKPSSDNEIASFSIPMKVEIRMLREDE